MRSTSQPVFSDIFWPTSSCAKIWLFIENSYVSLSVNLFLSLFLFLHSSCVKDSDEYTSRCFPVQVIEITVM